MNELRQVWFSPKEVAEHFSVTTDTVWSWIRTKKIKAVRINSRNYRIHLNEILSLHERLENGRISN